MPITFSFLPFCTRVYPSSLVDYTTGALDAYFLRTRRYVTVHTRLSRSTYMGFFSQMRSSDVGCITGFLSIAHHRVHAFLLKVGGQGGRGGGGFFSVAEKEKAKERVLSALREFCSASNLFDKRERYEVINFSWLPGFRIPFRSTWNNL